MKFKFLFFLNDAVVQFWNRRYSVKFLLRLFVHLLYSTTSKWVQWYWTKRIIGVDIIESYRHYFVIIWELIIYNRILIN